MITRNAGSARLVALSCMAFVLFQLVIGCGTTPQNVASSVTPTPPPAQPTQAPAATTSASPVSPSQTPGLHGPTNFLLATPFNFSHVNGATMDDNGATTALDPNMVKTEVTGEMERLLFVMDSNDNMKVYSPGSSPVSAQLTFNSDGSTSIDYTQTATSDAGTITILFSGVLASGQITTTYEQQYSPSMLINALASDVEVSFTTRVKWVTANQIPAAPTNGQSQFTSSGGVTLSWSGGQNAVAYDIYRLISDQDQQFHLLATVKGTSYTDNSAQTIQNMHSVKGVTYAVFSVGPTGVENPGGIVISV